MDRRINWSGLVIAGIGFFVTRFTVSLALYEEPVRFYIAGVLPLAIGLSLAAFGVAMTIGDIQSAVVRTTAMWCVLGATSMLLFGLLTIYGTGPGRMELSSTIFRSYLSNFLIGGSVGGTLTGLYAARNRLQRRQLRQHSDRLVVLNRLLRHEILNAITAIQGYATLDSSYKEQAREVITERSSGIERTIEKVKYFTGRAGEGTDHTGAVEIRKCLERATSEVETRHPKCSVSVPAETPESFVWADEQLVDVFTQLLDNAVTHGHDPEPTVSVSSSASMIQVTVQDDGPGLPPTQQALLNSGDIDEFDNPTTGFGLNLVRFYVDEYGGTIDVSADNTGTEITVSLRRAKPDSHQSTPTSLDFSGVRPAMPHIVIAVFAALIAGVSYGFISEILGGSVAGIGVFYGTVDPVIGWITHQFHSVVFGLVFIGLIAIVPDHWPDGFPTFLGLGIGWAIVVWIGAASIVAPVWLQLSGISVPVPNFSMRFLASHVAWGITLAIATFLGYRQVLPRIYARIE